MTGRNGVRVIPNGRNVFGAGAKHRFGVESCFVDRRVKEALGRKRLRLLVDRRAVERKRENIVGNNGARTARAREQEARGIRRIANADIPKRINNSKIGENAVGDYQILDRPRR